MNTTPLQINNLGNILKTNALNLMERARTAQNEADQNFKDAKCAQQIADEFLASNSDCLDLVQRDAIEMMELAKNSQQIANEYIEQAKLMNESANKFSNSIKQDNNVTEMENDDVKEPMGNIYGTDDVYPEVKPFSDEEYAKQLQMEIDGEYHNIIELNPEGKQLLSDEEYAKQIQFEIDMENNKVEEKKENIQILSDEEYAKQLDEEYAKQLEAEFAKEH